MRHLRYFLAVAEEEHFGRGARRAHVVQPALTKAVQQLERELGVELFHRLPRGVRLTEAGAAFREEARAVLAQLERAAERARRVGRGEEGRLVVGFVEGLNYHPVFLQAMSRFRASRPRVELALEGGSSSAQWEAVAAGRLHLGLVQSLPTEEGLASAPVFDDPLVLALPPGSPLAAKRGVTLHMLDELPLVWFRREASPAFHDAVAEAFRAAGVRMRVAHEVASHVSCGSMVAAGAGATLVPASMAATLPPGVHTAAVLELPVRARVHALWHPGRRSAAAAEFHRLLGEAGAEHQHMVELPA